MSRIKNLIRNLNYLSKHSLWDQREEDIVYLTNKILEDAVYEYGLEVKGYKKPIILSKKESMQLIFKGNKSFIRTGDGECKIIIGMDQPFQKSNQEIVKGLKKILRNDNENLLVGLNGNYFTPLFEIGNPQYYRRNAYDLRRIYSKYINFDSVYIHSAITGYQFGQEQSEEIIEQYHLWHQAFADKNIVVVCGEGILEKCQYDVFDLARSKKIIYGPNKNAWEQHDLLMQQILDTAAKDQIIVFVLGMAGKVMISELTELGYTCWDVGHLVKFYDVFMRAKPMSEDEIAQFYAPD